MGPLLTLKIKKKDRLIKRISKNSAVVYHLPVADQRLRIKGRLTQKPETRLHTCTV